MFRCTRNPVLNTKHIWFLLEKINVIHKLSISDKQVLCSRCCLRGSENSIKYQRLIEKASERHDKDLDVTNILKNKTRVDMLIQSIFNKEQKALLKV